MAADRTGGPLDQLLDQLRLRIPGLIVERLQVTHPADDDVYFIGLENGHDRVQLDTAPDGHPTLHIETATVTKPLMSATRSTPSAAIWSKLLPRPPVISCPCPLTESLNGSSSRWPGCPKGALLSVRPRSCCAYSPRRYKHGP
jgi:hypothetical protein